MEIHMQRIMKKHIIRPYKLKPVLSLQPHDDTLRDEFFEILLIKIKEDPECLKKVIWKHEANFSNERIYN